MTKFLNISTDNTLGGSSASDVIVASQKAVRDYINSQLANIGTRGNVGDIFFTARKDSGLNGAVECNGGTYNTGDFTGAQNIGQLLEDGKIPYVSLSQYATLLSSNGSVGVFGWDGTGTTTFRVPSLTDIFIETGIASQIGDYISAGLPNITGTFESHNRSLSGGTGAFTGSSNGSSQGLSGVGSFPRTMTLDASNSNSIYGNSTTVQPTSVRYRAMVQLFITSSDEALATCTSVAADVATMKSHELIAFQEPTAQNNYSWYRKYRDGWVEQGGRDTIASRSSAGTSNTTINLLVEMADVGYTPDFVPVSQQTNWGYCTYSRSSLTTTSFKASCYTGQSIGFGQLGIAWTVKGKAAN